METHYWDTCVCVCVCGGGMLTNHNNVGLMEYRGIKKRQLTFPAFV